MASRQAAAPAARLSSPAASPRLLLAHLLFLLLPALARAQGLPAPVCVRTRADCDPLFLPPEGPPRACVFATRDSTRTQCDPPDAEGTVACSDFEISVPQRGILCGAPPGFFTTITPPTTTTTTTTTLTTTAPPPPTTSAPLAARVYYAADNRIAMFVNGVRRGALLTDWRRFANESVALRDGDVVAFEVRDFGVWFGLIAAIRVSPRAPWLSTGTAADGDWRAVEESRYAGPRDAWKTAAFDACAAWPRPALLPRAGQIFNGKARGFPYAATGARYVWAAGAGRRDTVYVRRVIGRTCPPTTS